MRSTVMLVQQDAAVAAVIAVAAWRDVVVLISQGTVLNIEGTRKAGDDIRGGCYDFPDGRDD